MIPKFILLLVMVSYTYGNHCPMNPKRCETVRCAQATREGCEKQGLDFVAKESICGCCDFCQPFSSNGEECGPKTEPMNGAKINCQPPSTCENGICT
uniref:Cysteine rich secreted protein n=1 Tax=Riptortus pedestris TaxID=329032 RepID=R4WDC9_RIPPE|nr:cysteine rich secreted protein [Riptortus pedestris]